MGYILYFSTLIANGILLFKKKPSKLIAIISFAIIGLFFAGNYESGDINNYLSMFSNIQVILDNSKIDKLFYYLMIFMQDRGMDFFSFKILLAIIIYPIFIISIIKFRVNVNYVLFFYLIHSFFMDVEQIRNTIALCIFIFGVHFLVDKGKDYILKYTACVFLATAFHASFIIYIILLVVVLPDKEKILKYIPHVIIIMCIFIFLNKNNIPFIDSVINRLNDEKASIYLSNKVNLGFLIPWALHLVSFSAIYYCKRLSDKLENDKKTNIVNTVYYIYIVSFIFFPLYMRSITFYRLSRNLCLLCICACSMINQAYKKGSLKKIKLNFILLGSILCWAIFDLYIRSNEILIPVLTKNLYFK
ncbi:EpsG family protein [Clostridium sp. P21]|uniref:EpsG family protein n=1 Tax=Clostridium muellerianum TaxID=2716538 RepID=A0A7Y0EKJ6_9CLOT|nr:EpsG family protein [Clostridium muellerianum]NMM65091.1 EpsG family protein [Clostridium muellerianum]